MVYKVEEAMKKRQQEHEQENKARESSLERNLSINESQNTLKHAHQLSYKPLSICSRK